MNVDCALLLALWLLQAQGDVSQVEEPVGIRRDRPVVPAALAAVAFEAVVGSHPEAVAFRLSRLAFTGHRKRSISRLCRKIKRLHAPLLSLNPVKIRFF